jgi:GWxTD domain-containing protein
VFGVACAALYYGTRRRMAPSIRHALLLSIFLRFALPAPLVDHWFDGSVSLPPSAVPARVEPLLRAPIALTAAPGAARDWTGALLFVWFGVAAILFVRAASQVFRSDTRSLLSAGGPVPVYISPQAEQPCVRGLFRPAVLIPEAAARAFTSDELTAVLLHEFTHVRRGDHLAAALQTVVSSLFWFHPLLWWAGRRISLERELACDDAVLAQQGQPDIYAAAIAKSCGSAISALNIAGSDFRYRMERIMSSPVLKVRLTHRLLAAAVIAAAVLSVVLPVPIYAQAGSYLKWVNEDVAYIISAGEREQFLRLSSDADRAAFIKDFWSKRDPDPSTAENEYKKEHYRRIAYANERFPSGVPGWRTERGRIYIVFGPPAEIESRPGQYERWAYRSGLMGGLVLEFKP